VSKFMLKLLTKFAVVCLIVVPVSWFLYSIGQVDAQAPDSGWICVSFFWGFMAFVIGAYQLFVFVTFLLRKALIFLGMKPETADAEYGGPGYGWWWR